MLRLQLLHALRVCTWDLARGNRSSAPPAAPPCNIIPCFWTKSFVLRPHLDATLSKANRAQPSKQQGKRGLPASPWFLFMDKMPVSLPFRPKAPSTPPTLLATKRVITLPFRPKTIATQQVNVPTKHITFQATLPFRFKIPTAQQNLETDSNMATRNLELSRGRDTQQKTRTRAALAFENTGAGFDAHIETPAQIRDPVDQNAVLIAVPAYVQVPGVFQKKIERSASAEPSSKSKKRRFVHTPAPSRVELILGSTCLYIMRMVSSPNNVVSE